MMKLLAMTIATLSLVAVTTALANIDPRPGDRNKSIETAAVPAKTTGATFAERRGRKCQENLGYGRAGSYGCG